ncbi:MULTISPECIES: hypothetical protein [Staphylococcus]|nr:hypothetical protein [Staphylococcus xylosus]
MILGFPCNQFAKQKPGTDDQIAKIWKENQMEFHKIYYC